MEQVKYIVVYVMWFIVALATLSASVYCVLKGHNIAAGWLGFLFFVMLCGVKIHDS